MEIRRPFGVLVLAGAALMILNGAALLLDWPGWTLWLGIGGALMWILAWVIEAAMRRREGRPLTDENGQTWDDRFP